MSRKEISPESCDRREKAASLIRNILQTAGENQEWLAVQLDVCQSTISRWISGATVPSQSIIDTLSKLLSDVKGRCWAGRKFVPICAFAESYPDDLAEKATEALNEMLNSAPLIPGAGEHTGDVSIDLHVRAARLPKGVKAYTFADDLDAPSVFVVLVQKSFPPLRQLMIGWEEVYAHVAKYPYKSVGGGRREAPAAGGLSAAPPLLRTMGHICINQRSGR